MIKRLSKLLTAVTIFQDENRLQKEF